MAEVAWAVGLLGGPFVALGAYVVAFIVHRRGRSPAGPLGLVAAGFGLLLGGGLVAGIGLLTGGPALALNGVIGALAPIVLLPAVTVVLARRGARRAAGLCLAAASIPWLLVWGDYALQLLGGREGATFTIGSALIAGLVVLGIGIAVAFRGDEDVTSPDAQAARRQIGRFGSAVTDRARLGPLTPSVVLTIVAVTALQFAPGLPAIAKLAIGVVAALAAVELELRAVPPSARPGVEAFHWIGRTAVQRFASIAGRPVPVTKKAAAEWLATPATDSDLELRPELLIWLDRRADALDVVTRLPDRTPVERFQKALEADFVVWSADGRGTGADLAALAAEIEDPVERLRVDGLLAWRASQRAWVAGDPRWLDPLHAFRGRLDRSVDGLHAGAMRTVTTIPAVGLATLIMLPTVVGA